MLLLILCKISIYVFNFRKIIIFKTTPQTMENIFFQCIQNSPNFGKIICLKNDKSFKEGIVDISFEIINMNHPYAGKNSIGQIMCPYLRLRKQVTIAMALLPCQPRFWFYTDFRNSSLEQSFLCHLVTNFLYKKGRGDEGNYQTHQRIYRFPLSCSQLLQMDVKVKFNTTQKAGVRVPPNWSSSLCLTLLSLSPYLHSFIFIDSGYQVI